MNNNYIEVLNKIRNKYEYELGNNLLYMSLYGSHLYKTNNDRSDYDIIMVYNEINLEKYKDKSYSNIKRESNFSIKDFDLFEVEVDIKVITLWSFLEGILNGYNTFSECLFSEYSYVSEDFSHFYNNRRLFGYKNLQGFTRSSKGEFYKVSKHLLKGKINNTIGSNRYYIDKYGYATKLIQQSYLTYLKMNNLDNGLLYEENFKFNDTQIIFAKDLKNGIYNKEKALELFYSMEGDIISIRDKYMNTFIEKDKLEMYESFKDYFKEDIRVYL